MRSKAKKHSFPDQMPCQYTNLAWSDPDHMKSFDTEDTEDTEEHLQ